MKPGVVQTFGFEAKPMASECLEAVAVQFKHDRVEAPPPTPLLAPFGPQSSPAESIRQLVKARMRSPEQPVLIAHARSSMPG
jgi:hypothetical protein